ncbi:hypothetical protein SLEP1_g1900 [Rubroshorea leprosula]|uniref:C2H2-type domain-containing protein n=1 Tax=Rubroshorea leprosula TaxID=152421 RepID=A0AAV5HP25_9ROSI|nr:hypothetical protein SLEP1_g1900 [Rubroshorea leprosula]
MSDKGNGPGWHRFTDYEPPSYEPLRSTDATIPSSVFPINQTLCRFLCICAISEILSKDEEGRMPGLTCNACNKEFNDDSEQRLHYKSDWHRYNLKRKIFSFQFFCFPVLQYSVWNMDFLLGADVESLNSLRI